MYRFIFCMVIGLVTGCATTSMEPSVQHTQPEPHQEQKAAHLDVMPMRLGQQGSKPLAFYRLLYVKPVAMQLAEQYEDVPGTTDFPYIASTEFEYIASRELRAYGYHVLGMESLLFDKNDWEPARYYLGGTATELRLEQFNTHDAAELTVEWQLYDATEEKILYTTSTTGYGEASIASPESIVKAFTASLHALMANQEFIAQVKQPNAQEIQSVSFERGSPIEFSCPEKAYDLPKDLDRVLESTVTIAGGASFGGGTLVSADGYILTAAHVVSGLAQTEAVLRSGIRLPARVIRIDMQQDVALLKLPGKGYTCVAMRLDDKPTVGSELYAIGTPWDKKLAHSVSKGIVSGYRRLWGKQLLQSDVSLNSGNSGGPLLDEKGQVVAIAVTKVDDADYEGLAFGVPMPVAAKRLSIRRMITQ